MNLWLTFTLMVVLAVCGLAIPLVRRASSRRDNSMAVLQTQLADVEGQRVAGLLSQEEADGLTTEIKRRILAEGRTHESLNRPFDGRFRPYLAAGLAVFIAAAATILYTSIGRPDLAARARLIAGEDGGAPASTRAHELQDIIEKLKARLAQSPNETQGWRLLGWAYLVIGRPSDSANAYSRAIALDPRIAADHSALGDALVQAAGGMVTPAALTAFRDATARDPADPRARYFLGLYKEQQGDHEAAMADWVALLKSAPADAPWLADVRAFVARVAREHGQDLSAILAGSSTNARAAPTTPLDQAATIHAMVDKLAADLRARPRNTSGWVQLMRSRMVLGETEAAAAAYRDAIKAFADAPAEQAQLRQAARALRVPGA
jgi:cytochrome c-type biogenesis protein CcmH